MLVESATSLSVSSAAQTKDNPIANARTIGWLLWKFPKKGQQHALRVWGRHVAVSVRAVLPRDMNSTRTIPTAPQNSHRNFSYRMTHFEFFCLPEKLLSSPVCSGCQVVNIVSSPVTTDSSNSFPSSLNC
jgi:hypothetical protein